MRFRRLVAAFLLVSISGALWAQMTPNAPVKNFRFPRFGENGYTEWVIQGQRGIYDSEEQVRVDEMALRVYSGDERMAKELTLDSPHATLRLKEDRAFSDEAIEIVGANFKISGKGWEWIGETKEIIVQSEVLVEFKQSISGGLTGGNEGGIKATTISSDQLVLQTTEAEYTFEFNGSVSARSGEMDVKSNILIAIADAPEGRREDAAKIESGKLDSIRRILAKEDVVIEQGDRVVRAQEAKFMTREKRVELSGTPQIEVSGAYLSGARVYSRAGEIIIEGSQSEGRAQMILIDTGGLGIQGGAALSNETILLANTIRMQEAGMENQFLFEGQVEVMSGAVMLNAAKMTILAMKVGSAGPADGETSKALKVGEVRRMVAEGGIRIEQEGQIASGERVTFFPAEERAVLSGSPKVTNADAVITGREMELRPGSAIVKGKEDEPVRVLLPEMPDMGYAAFRPNLPGSTQAGTASAIAPAKTVVQSNLLRMTEGLEHTLFRFSGSVEVTATNLKTSCQRLDVIAVEQNISDRGGIGEGFMLNRIEAHDEVIIQQTGRTATADRAFILPAEGKLVLEGTAVVEDERGRVSGHRMVLLQGQRRAIVEGGGPEGERAKITLPALGTN